MAAGSSTTQAPARPGKKTKKFAETDSLDKLTNNDYNQCLRLRQQPQVMLDAGYWMLNHP
jgi:hypothetical protein